MRKLGYIAVLIGGSLAAQDSPTFRFAVSGDSRNCGNIVMPAIASAVHRGGAQFYWHLGDFRAIYMFDEDMVPPPKLGLKTPAMNIISYLTAAWPSFIEHQLDSFGNTPVYLGIGNHETIPPSTRDSWLLQFADWLNSPTIRAQRLKDNPDDHKLRSYYHWISHGIDFISVDNASLDQFDAGQLNWIRTVISRAESSPEIKSIVIGMHAALPGSIGNSHSMGASPLQDKTGRDVYAALWHAENVAHKKVYVLASHSHFYMENVYDTPDWKGRVLPGWIVGTAGAVRYPLPPEAGPKQKGLQGIYGFLMGTASADGSISFAFHRVTADDMLVANKGHYDASLVHWCEDENKQY